MADRVITADDVVRAGACADGVRKRLRRLASSGCVLAAAVPIDQALSVVPADERSYVLAAINDGNGNGDGDGDGYGDGDGDGYGNGYGDGNGNGNGYG